jgi:dGTPase
LRADFFTLEELTDLPLLGEIVKQVLSDYSHLEKRRQTHEVVRRMITRMVSDVLGEVRTRLSEESVESVDDIRALSRPIAEFSVEMQESNKQVKAFLMQRMYRHYRVNRVTSKVRRVVRDLFELLLAEPDCLPPRWRDAAGAAGSLQTALVVCDFVAGMTDRFALEEHARLFDPLFRY